MKLSINKYIKYSIVTIVFILWVIWVGNLWLFLGLPIIFDIYITKKVNWTPWKSRTKKNNTIVEWIDALIFAVVAVTLINIFLFQNYKIPTGSMEKTLLVGDHLYVTKLKYGPKLPNTPIAFPFTQNTLPLTKSTQSYLDWPMWGYKRLKGFTTIKNNDIVVFNFPGGDTVMLENQNYDYYDQVRAAILETVGEHPEKPLKSYYNLGRQKVMETTDLVFRPVDRRDNYIKRCAAIPGDTLQIVDGQVYINGKPQPKFPDMQYRYKITTDGNPINPSAFDKMGIYNNEISTENNNYILFLTQKNVELIKGFVNVKSIEHLLMPKNEFNFRVFPHDERYSWNEDNFGPLWIPKKGVTIHLSQENLPLYERIIGVYEHNKLEVHHDSIFINGKLANSYTFQMDYYFMMGDNRHNSLDSRFWGFVPEDHIVGAPKFVWLSLDPTKSFPANIRWSRMFTRADK